MSKQPLISNASERYAYDDGGAFQAGFTTTNWRAGCVPRAIAIALDLPYGQVYREMSDQFSSEQVRHGGFYPQEIMAYLEPRGWSQHCPTYAIAWLPMPQAISVTIMLLAKIGCYTAIIDTSNHAFAVKGGQIRDVFDPSVHLKKGDSIESVYTLSQPIVK